MSAPETFALIDVLRYRRELAAEEVAALVAELPVMLQEVVERPPNLLGAVRVVFPSGTPAERLMAKPVDSWPPFRLRWEHEDSDDCSTLHVSLLPTPDAPAQFAALLYELLGGRRRDGAFIPPLAGLNEAGNAVLRRALSGGAFGDCQALWRAWLHTLEPETAAPLMKWRIPPQLDGIAEPATVIELLPEVATQTPVRLVAREQFRIGRSHLQCDWPARGRNDEEASLAVSRVHLTGIWLPDGPAFRDGGDSGPSKFGTTFDGAPLAAGELRPLRAGGSFTLGDEYRLEAWRVVDAGFRGLVKPDAAIDPARGEEARRGAVFFQAPDRSDSLRDAVWLGSEIAFRLAAPGGLDWGRASDSGEVAWFLHRHGQFWLANSGLSGAPIYVAGLRLDQKTVAPLANGQALEIGPLRYTVVRVE